MGRRSGVVFSPTPPPGLALSLHADIRLVGQTQGTHRKTWALEEQPRGRRSEDWNIVTLALWGPS